MNRIKYFQFRSRDDVIVASRRVIDAQDNLIEEYRWNLFIAKRNARIWYWLWMATAVIHIVSMFI